MEFKYSEIVTNGVFNRGTILEIPNGIHELNYFGKSGSDCYSSVYLHSEKYLEYAKQHKSENHTGISGYLDKVQASFVHWDFDDKDLGQAFDNSKTLIARLCHNYECDTKQIRLYFSGNKGFHVLLLSPELELMTHKVNIPAVVKAFACSLAGDLTSFDDAIYDITRIFRIPNSKHGKTGLYKIPIEHNDSLESIKEKAKTQQQIDFCSIEEFETNEKIQEVINQCINDLKNTFENNGGWHLNGNELCEGMLKGFSEGNRNKGLFSLGRVLFNRGIDRNIVSAFLHTVNENRNMGLPSNEIETIISHVIKYPVKEGLKEPEKTDILTMKQAADLWKKHLEKLKKIDFGFEKLNKCMPYFTDGEVFFIAARAGCGKTTLGMHIGNNIAKDSNSYTLFFSLEMQAQKIFFRAATIDQSEHSEEGLDSVGVLYQLEDEKNVIKTVDNWNKFLIVDKDSLTLQQVEEYLIKAREKYIDIACIVIDYFGYLSGGKGSNYEVYTKIAKAIKGLAKRQDIRIVILCQTSRAGLDGTEPIKLHFLRDTGAIEESADYVLGLWKSKNDEKRLHCEILKNRNDSYFDKFDFINKGLYFIEEVYVKDREVEGEF